ncbi:SecY subunit domain-containing protein [Zopfochytrium polystomum]|nr:SecY subunit domain-containing protein [Zopfochytrium polystomum]
MSFRLLHVVKPFLALLPEVSSPLYKVPGRDKIMWTGVALLVFIVCSHFPLFGVIHSETSSDPLYFTRVVLGSSRGSLMELGLLPIITSSTILQLLAGAGLIEVDYTLKEDRALFSGAQKLFAVVLAIIYSVLNVTSGIYGDVKELGPFVALLLVVQLTAGALLATILDELIQKGHGLGSGISLFIATSICEDIASKTFSFSSHSTGKGTEYEGAFSALFQLLYSRRDKFRALKEAFYRSNLPNIFGLLVTLAIFAAVIYVQSFRLEVPVKSNRVRGQQAAFPVKLLYNSSTPLLILTAAVGNVFYLSQLLYKRFPEFFLVRLIGVWKAFEGSSQEFASGGIVYYISAPHSLFAALSDPLRFIVYTAFMLVASYYLNEYWTDIAGNSAYDVSKQLQGQGLTIFGHREVSIYRELKRIIMPAATLGGVIIAALVVVADLFGAIGTGTGILLGATMMYQYFEILVKEQYEDPNIFSAY